MQVTADKDSPEAMIASASDTIPAELLYAEQTALLYRQGGTGLLATLVLASGLCALFLDRFASLPVLLWYVTAMLVTVARYGLLRVYLRAAPPPVEAPRWARYFMLGGFFGGLVWGLAGVGLLSQADASAHIGDVVVLSMVIVGVTAAGVPLYASLLKAFYLFALPALLPLSLALLMLGGELFQYLGGMTLLYAYVLVVTARRVHDTVIGSLRLRYANTGLVNELMVAQSQMRDVNKQLQDEVRRQNETRDALETKTRLVDSIRKAQARFIENPDPRELFDDLLGHLLELTGSEYGFIGEVKHRPDGSPFLKTFAITNIAWNDETQRFYADNAPNGLEFVNLDSLFGAVMTSGEAVIANDPAHDPRACGLPAGHPSLDAFLGVPFFHGGQMLGMVGIANRVQGYDQTVIHDLQPFLNTCANIIHAHRNNALREQAEGEVRDKEERLRAILDNIAEGVMTLDAQGRILSLNQAGERMFLVSANEVCEMGFDRLINAAERSRYQAWLAVHLEQPGSAQEFTAQRSDGSGFPLAISMAPMQLGGESLLVTVLRDVSEQHKINRMKNEFISTVSHELRTPLTSIRGALGLLAGGAAGALPEQANTMLALASSNSERLVRLINDILDMDKIESGEMALDIRPLELARQLEEALAHNKAFADQFNIQLQLEAVSAELQVQADADRLQQVLTNLLSNAVKFSPPSTAVVVSVKAGEACVRISVCDRGPGIPPEHRQRIFDKFTQVDSSDTRQSAGTGLGLSISKALVEQMGGEIGFHDRDDEGGGTCFYFDLPQGLIVAGETSPAGLMP